MRAASTGDRGALAAAGAALTAALSSACCWLPLLLVAFGASAAGVSGFFEAYRWPLLAVTAGLLGIGFRLVYFSRPHCAPGSACAVPDPGRARLSKAALWAATAAAAAFAFFPDYVGSLVGGRAPGVADAATIELDVRGMTCAGCAVHVERELRSVAGVLAVEVSYEDGRATAALDPTSPRDDTKLLRAVERAGYTATIVGAPASLPQPPTRGNDP